MLLHTGESLRLQEAAQKVYEGGRLQGVLFLTDRRLVYEEHRSGGLLSHGAVTTVVNLHLHEITNVSIVRQLVGSPKFQIESHRGSHIFKVGDPHQWANAVVATRSAIPPAPPPPPPTRAIPPPPTAWNDHRAGVPNVTVHVTTAPPPVSPGAPVPVVMFPCPYCRRPQPSHLTQCEACGAPLRA